jgi:hypothetical protein
VLAGAPQSWAQEVLMSVTLGPVDVAVIEFDGNHFDDGIAAALAEAVDAGVVRIVDMVLVTKDAAGTVASVELDDAEPDVVSSISPLADEISGLLSQDDVRQIGQDLGPNRSAAMIVFENAWLRRVRQAIIDANGRVITQERIPADVVERALAARETS